jgi:gluconolactonase
MIAKRFGIALMCVTALSLCEAQDSRVTADGAEVKKLAGDFRFTEGPAADARGDIYFTDIPNNRILKWSVEEGKLSTFLENSGGANGLYFDKDGNLLACQGGARRLVSISAKGEITVLAERYDGKKFNSPNDLWIDPKGGVYFTDPRYGNREGMEQDGEHVYYLAPDYRNVTRVIDDMVRPNGVIGTPDGRRLFVADHGAGRTYSYRINQDGTLSDKQLFAPQGSDGLALDTRGNLYLTTKVVAVYNSQGERIQEIQIPEGPANLTFGGPDNQTLFVTARTSLYAVQMETRGSPTPVRPRTPQGRQPQQQ